MKRKVFVVVLAFVCMSQPVFAQSWISQILNRYRPSPLNQPAGQTLRSDPLSALARAGTIPLSVSDLIRLTLENNLDVAVDRYSPFSTGFLTAAAYQPFEPTLRLGAGVSRETSPSRTQLEGAPSISQLSHNYTIGFGQTLQTGTNFTVDFTMFRSSSNNAFSTFNPSWVGQLRYEVTQPLLRNFGRRANTRQIRISQNNTSISEIQFEQQVIDLVVQAQKAYWDLVFSAEDQKVKQRSLDLAQKTLADNETQVKIGTLAPVDLIQARRQVATSREDLVVTSFTQTQVEDQLKKLLSPEPDPGLVLARVEPTQGTTLPSSADVLPLDMAIKVAFENRPELRQLALELQNRDIEIEYARNQLLPSVNVTAGYLQNGVGGVETLRSGFGPGATIISVTPGGQGDALGQLFGFKYTGWSVGFDVQIPLRNRAPQAEYSRAVTEKRTTETRVKALEQQIILDIRNALTQVEMNKARIENAQLSRSLAEEQLKAEQRRFDLGASTVRFVLEEQRNLTQMQTNEIAALVNYTKALVDYERAIGMTLKKHDIAIEKSLIAAR